jgi:hypothetical protein
LISLSVLLAGPALATDLTPEQLKSAEGVFVGEASCDMKETVHLKAIDGKPGHFELTHKKARYTLTPEVTTTGAVRLEDRQAGVVWLQIPAKSMLLNAKLGRREVDGCLHAEQIAEASAAKATASTSLLGTPAIGVATR